MPKRLLHTLKRKATVTIVTSAAAASTTPTAITTKCNKNNINTQLKIFDKLFHPKPRSKHHNYQATMYVQCLQ